MKRRNPYWKYVKCETLLQHHVAQYVKLAHKNIMIHHSPNEANRSPFERFLVGIMSVSSGFPDLYLTDGKKDLYLELKYQDNVPTQSQKEWICKLNMSLSEKKLAVVVWTYEAAVKLINYHYTGVMSDDHNNEYDDQIKEYEGMCYLDTDIIPKKFLVTKYN